MGRGQASKATRKASRQRSRRLERGDDRPVVISSVNHMGTDGRWSTMNQRHSTELPTRLVKNGILKGRDWAIQPSMTNRLTGEVTQSETCWELWKEEVIQSRLVIEVAERKILLCEYCQEQRETAEKGKKNYPDGKVYFKRPTIGSHPFITDDDDIADWKKYITGYWDIEKSIETCKATIRLHKADQRFHTYMYNEQSPERVARAKAKLIKEMESVMESGFESSQKDVGYWVLDAEGKYTSSNGEQAYIEFMDRQKELREKIDYYEEIYVYGMTKYGRFSKA